MREREIEWERDTCRKTERVRGGGGAGKIFSYFVKLENKMKDNESKGLIVRDKTMKVKG